MQIKPLGSPSSLQRSSTSPPAFKDEIGMRALAGRLFQVKTPVVEEYAAKVVEALERGEHGVMVYGAPRLGRTMATRWILNQVTPIFGSPVASLEMPVRENSGKSQNQFFSYLLYLAKHRHQSGSITDKRNRAVKWLAVRARRSQLNAVVLFIDEAHVLPAHAYRWLLEIDNELDCEGLRLFVITVGQRALLETRKSLGEMAGGDQFVERFMATQFSFRGLRSEEEVRQCLVNFATTEYPQGSGRRFAEHYISALVERGYDLGAMAPPFWAECADVWSERLTGTPELPMTHFTRSMILLLRALANTPGLEPSADQIELAIKQSAYSGYVKRRADAALRSQR